MPEDEKRDEEVTYDETFLCFLSELQKDGVAERFLPLFSDEEYLRELAELEAEEEKEEETS